VAILLHALIRDQSGGIPHEVGMVVAMDIPVNTSEHLASGADRGNCPYGLTVVGRKTGELGSVRIAAEGRSKEITMNKIIGDDVTPTPPVVDPEIIDDGRQPAVEETKSSSDEINENQASQPVEASKIIGNG